MGVQPPYSADTSGVTMPEIASNLASVSQHCYSTDLGSMGLGSILKFGCNLLAIKMAKFCTSNVYSCLILQENDGSRYELLSQGLGFS